MSAAPRSTDIRLELMPMTSVHEGALKHSPSTREILVDDRYAELLAEDFPLPGVRLRLVG